MRFSPERFNRHLTGIGQRFAWRRSYACPCVNPHSGAARPGCRLCFGAGRSWSAPVESMAGISGRSVLAQFKDLGVLDAGDVLLSLPSSQPIYEMGQFDRVQMIDRTEPFSLNIVRGLNDRLRFDVVSIDRVFWLGPGETPVEGQAPDVAADGVLSWPAGGPPAGVTYSITGRRHPDYYCYLDLPLDRPYHAGAKLPRRVLLRRFDLFGR